MDVNEVRLTGTVKRDADARNVREGLRTIDFTLVVHGPGRPLFVDCVAYGETVEGLDGFVEAGERLGLVGNLTFRTMTERDGSLRRTSLVYASEVWEIEED